MFVLLLGGLEIETFCRNFDRAGFRPWLLDLDLFLHLLVLALLYIIRLRLSPAANFFQLLMTSFLFLNVFLARFPIGSTKFDSPIGRRICTIDIPIGFLLSIQTHT